MNARVLSLVLCISAVVTITGCSPKNVRVPTITNVAPADNSYLDLKPGGTLRVIVPLLKSGAYEASSYAITGNSGGTVRLKFESVEISRDGKTVQQPNPSALPFKLPRRAEHIRLIYLVRVSQSDHNMAIVASQDVAALNAFTKQLKQSPSICARDKKIFCAWVPTDVAVRSEGR